MRRHHRRLLVPTALQLVAVASRAITHGQCYLLQVIKLDQDLVNLPVGELAHDFLVLVIWLLACDGCLAAAIFDLVVLVHKIIFVVGIIAANVDVAERVGKCFSRRSLEVL